ncbi:hypothetical protein E1294_51965, partial [Nonomuraea diastatica]
MVQPLGGGVRPRGFFAVGAEEAFSPVTHTVINAAGSLLTLAMEQGRSQLEAERRVRSAVLRLLLEGAQEQARVVVEPLGRRLPEEPLVALATGPEALDVLETYVFAALHDDTDTWEGQRQRGGRRSQVRSARTQAKGRVAIALVAAYPADGPAPGQMGGAPGGAAGGLAGGPVGGAAGGSAEDVAVRMAEMVALEADVPVGVSLPCVDGPAALRSALDQARRALEAAEASSGPSAGRTGGGSASRRRGVDSGGRSASGRRGVERDGGGSASGRGGVEPGGGGSASGRGGVERDGGGSEVGKGGGTSGSGRRGRVFGGGG